MNPRLQSCLFASLVTALLSSASLSASGSATGTVMDCNTHRPIEGAWVTSGTQAQRTNRDGQFKVSPNANVDVRAIGYSRTRTGARDGMEICLSPLRVHGLYLSFWGVGSQVLRTGCAKYYRTRSSQRCGDRYKGRPRLHRSKGGFPAGETGRREQNSYHS